MERPLLIMITIYPHCCEETLNVYTFFNHRKHYYTQIFSIFFYIFNMQKKLQKNPNHFLFLDIFPPPIHLIQKHPKHSPDFHTVFHHLCCKYFSFALFLFCHTCRSIFFAANSIYYHDFINQNLFDKSVERRRKITFAIRTGIF